MSSALAAAALQKFGNGSGPEESVKDDSALRDAAKEMWEAVKEDDADAFSVAFENALEIRLSKE